MSEGNRSQKQISRRYFLKLTGLSVLGLASPLTLKNINISRSSTEEPATSLGRVLHPEDMVFGAPKFTTIPLRTVVLNTIVNLEEEVEGSPDQYNNRIWYKVKEGGYIHSAAVQLVENKTNPITNLWHIDGQLAQVTVPFTQGWKTFHINRNTFEPFYFGSTHWVETLVEDEQGVSFYRMREDRWGDIYFIPTTHIHVLTTNELQPISADTPPQEKRIEVRLQDQMMAAFEGDRLVLLSPISSGQVGTNEDFSTPPGSYEVTYKRPSRHMVHSDRIGFDDGELFGVPWVSYFTDTGIAFHGTYWHNEFGRPRSHGCVNLPIDAARFIYLWTLPTVPPLEKTYTSNHGTRVLVY